MLALGEVSMRIALFLCVVCFLSAPAQARPPWKDVDGNEYDHASIEEVKLGQLHFKDGKIVRFVDLVPSDQRYARRLWGFKVVPLNGIYRSDSGTVYAINEFAGGKVAATMLDSPAFSIVQGSFERKNKSLVSRQWQIKFLDPKKGDKLWSKNAVLTIDSAGNVTATWPKWFELPDGSIRWKGKTRGRLEPIPYSHIPLHVRQQHCGQIENSPNSQKMQVACRMINGQNLQSTIAKACLVETLRFNFPDFSQVELVILSDLLASLHMNPVSRGNAQKEIKNRLCLFSQKLCNNQAAINFCAKFAAGLN